MATVDDGSAADRRGSNPVRPDRPRSSGPLHSGGDQHAGIAPHGVDKLAEQFQRVVPTASIDNMWSGDGWVLVRESAQRRARAGACRSSKTRAGGRDSTRVVRDLWDSWEDDAVIRGRRHQRYLDRDTCTTSTHRRVRLLSEGAGDRAPTQRAAVGSRGGLLARSSSIILYFLLTPALPRRHATNVHGAAKVALDTPERRPRSGSHTRAWPNWAVLPIRQDRADGWSDCYRLAGTVGRRGLHPLVLDEDLAVLYRLVVPSLRGRRVAERRTFRAASLSTTLGLARPASSSGGMPDDRRDVPYPDAT